MMDAEAYEDHHRFVWELGGDVVALLDPRPGERILDLGCGGGQLSATMAGSQVTGVDSDPVLIGRARARYPELRWIVADIAGLDLGEAFDGVFSNAVLHWLPGPQQALAVVERHLAPGGRFVAEFGGSGNCAALIAAILAVHPDQALAHPWYFPGEAEYRAAIEVAGLVPDLVTRFSRPTRLEAGPAGWVRAFGGWATAGIGDVAGFLEEVEEVARPTMWRGDHWEADYVRLRVRAHKADPAAV